MGALAGLIQVCAVCSAQVTICPRREPVSGALTSVLRLLKIVISGLACCFVARIGGAVAFFGQGIASQGVPEQLLRVQFLPRKFGVSPVRFGIACIRGAVACVCGTAPSGQSVLLRRVIICAVRLVAVAAL